MKKILLLLLIPIIAWACNGYTQKEALPKFEVVKSDAEWKKLLSPEQFMVTRKKSNERAFSGKYANNHESGIYQCICCKLELFTSNTKFESGTGWASFWSPVNSNNIVITFDDRPEIMENEVICKRCGAHLGYIYDDGVKPTGKRYSINSSSLLFVKK
jgi:peptide-methionine (R)-S-oxide reductase